MYIAILIIVLDIFAETEKILYEAIHLYSSGKVMVAIQVLMSTVLTRSPGREFRGQSHHQSQIRCQIRQSQINNQTNNQIRSQINNQIRNQINNQIRSQINNQIRSQINNQIRSQINNQIRSQINSQIRSQMM